MQGSMEIPREDNRERKMSSLQAIVMGRRAGN